MDNTRIINATVRFKDKLRIEIEKDLSHSNEMKGWLWKTLIMSEIAHRSFDLEIQIESFEKVYFNNYVAIARHFRDWNMDWIADNYFEITNYIGKYYWPDDMKEDFDCNYEPFKLFSLE
ncbi:hypothetical protein [Flavobacterium difficile]|uniref:Uncharacterized protein n=1 Tax=Flavobacterium difficile TaxID=2709659 RepID=A0ABX0I8A2_9FLAO|nr:hypothetical protein [Flavobacterium difficile]NHM02834.1 hypothetical protein [Flavobacterium difficile]NHM02837.1 hypothetical protein [Flavobacterium difficile]